MSSKSETTGYRLLGTNEIIRQGDEHLNDDAETWGPVNRWAVGLAWNGGMFQPVRRPLAGMEPLHAE
jgi:hypothetical protein